MIFGPTTFNKAAFNDLRADNDDDVVVSLVEELSAGQKDRIMSLARSIDIHVVKQERRTAFGYCFLIYDPENFNKSDPIIGVLKMRSSSGSYKYKVQVGDKPDRQYTTQNFDNLISILRGYAERVKGSEHQDQQVNQVIPLRPA